MIKKIHWLILITMLLFASTTAFCNDPKTQDNNSIYGYEKNQTTDYNTFNDGLKMIVSLLIVLALIVGSVFLLKKIPIYKNIMKGTRQPISVISNFSLGHKRSVCVLKVANEVLILGLTNTNISILSKMNTDEYYSSDTLKKGDSENVGNSNLPNENQNFFDLLKKAIGKN